MGEAGLTSLGVEDGQVSAHKCPDNMHQSWYTAHSKGSKERPLLHLQSFNELPHWPVLVDRTSPTFLEGSLQHALRFLTY